MVKKKASNLREYIILYMRDRDYCKPWDIRDYILDKYGKVYSTDSINAQIRALRDPQIRSKYGLEDLDDCVPKRKLKGSSAYEYKLLFKGEKNGKEI